MKSNMKLLIPELLAKQKLFYLLHFRITFPLLVNYLPYFGQNLYGISLRITLIFMRRRTSILIRHNEAGIQQLRLRFVFLWELLFIWAQSLLYGLKITGEMRLIGLFIQL